MSGNATATKSSKEKWLRRVQSVREKGENGIGGPSIVTKSTVTLPFKQLSVDLITDLPPSAGFDSVMVMVDHGLTKGVILTPCQKTIDGAGIAQLFFDFVFKRFGLHNTLISDRGPQFASAFARELAHLLNYDI